MRIYAHRGASQTFPENTLDAFSEAVRLGVDGIELDVRATSDGIPVISHDSSLSRNFGMDSEVSDVTVATLREIAPSAPTLADVLDLVGATLHLDIEVKQAGIERELLALLAQYPDTRWSISCFDWQVLARFRELDARCDLWLLSLLLTADLIETAHRLRASTVALQASVITAQSITSARQGGLSLMAWTVNDVAKALQLQEWGLDMLCTDAPHLFVR